MFKKKTLRLNIGDLFTERCFDDLWVYQVVEERYKSGFKYKLKVVSDGHWSNAGKWLTAKQILNQYKPAPLGKFLYV